MTISRKTLGEYFKNEPSLFTEGNGLDSQRTFFEMPWLDDANFAEYCLPALDELYAARSYEKYAGRLIKRYAGDNALTQADVDHLAMDAIALFFDKWCKEWATRSVVYNPIDNYNMTEIMTDDERVIEHDTTNTRTDDLERIHTGTDTETKNLTETETPNLTTTEQRKINGFNSSGTGVNDGSITTQASGTDTTTNTGTDAFSRYDTEENSGTVTDAKTGTDTETRNYELTRQGNIGVTTTQQMLQSERDLWKWNYFTEVVFPDLDSVFTLKIY